MGTKISDLPAAGSLSEANLFALVQSSATKKLTLTQLRAEIRDQQRWFLIASTKYTATPASTSRITMSDTGDMAKGLPLKYVYDGITYYAIVTDVSPGAYVDLAGAPLDTGHDLTAFYIGTPEVVVQIDFFISGTYGDGVADLLGTDMKCYFKWGLADAFLVAFEAVQASVDTGAEAKVNVKIAGDAVSTNDSNKGIQLGAAGTWVANSAVAINTNYNDIHRGDAIEIRCTEAGGTGDGDDLTVSCFFVME